MKLDIIINEHTVIPEHELEIQTSRAGGPGGQHVNKTESRVTIRWNAISTTAFDETQKARLLKNLQPSLTTEGDLIVHASASRSQLQNKEAALETLKTIIRKALITPKKRKPTKVSKAAKEKRLKIKAQKSQLKKSRSKKIDE